MSARYRLRIRQFRENILNLRELPKPNDSTRGVFVDWPDPSLLLNQSWTTSFDNIWYETGGAVREWVLRRKGLEENDLDEEWLDIRLYVSSSGFLAARKYFLRQALSPTIPLEELNYESRMEGEIASLFLRTPIVKGKSDESVLQLFRNVVFSMRSHKTDVETRNVVARLQEIAEQNPDESIVNKRPPLPIQPAPPLETLQPGAEVTVGLPAEPDQFASFEEADFEVRIQTRGVGVDFSGFRGPRAHFLMTQPGTGQLLVQVIDRRTLISREVALKIQIKEDA